MEALGAVKAEIAAIHQKMSYLATLTPEQREERKPKVRAKDLLILRNRVEAARQNRKLIPPTIDLPKLEQDAALTAALSEVIAVLDKVRDHVNDTLLLIGCHAATTAASTNTYIKVALDVIALAHGRQRVSKGLDWHPFLNLARHFLLSAADEHSAWEAVYGGGHFTRRFLAVYRAPSGLNAANLPKRAKDLDRACPKTE